MIKYVLVDLDGTITDSGEGVTKSIQYALHHFGIEVENLTTLQKYIGPPLTWSFADAGVPAESVATAVEKYRERYNTTGIYEAYVYDGVPEMLKKLHEAGKTLILATSKPLHFAKRVLEYFGTDKLLDELCGADDARNRHEKFEVIEDILAKFDITDKSEVLMLGDTRFDVEGANICGIKTMGVLWGFGSRESLTKEGAAYIAETPADAAEQIIHL